MRTHKFGSRQKSLDASMTDKDSLLCSLQEESRHGKKKASVWCLRLIEILSDLLTFLNGSEKPKISRHKQFSY